MHKNWVSVLQRKIEASESKEFLAGKNLKSLFPRDYREDFTEQEALDDFIKIDHLFKFGCLQARLIDDHKSARFSIKLYAMDEAVPLSRSMSMLESMGLDVNLEKPYRLSIEDHNVWLHHFSLQRHHESCSLDKDKMSEYFEEMFQSLWHKQIELDLFNQLLFTACLPDRNIEVLRAYSAYLNQINFPYSRALIIETLAAHPSITRQLINIFLGKFNPEGQRTDQFEKLRADYLEGLNEIESLDQDLIFKQLLNLIEATVRTNYYQPANRDKVYISFKFESGKVQQLPHPHPLFEIFVYSSRFEGIHLRGGKVARGGLRWSDRKEDYRTEVLGLMKAQIVKNAVIVPSGSKGGFITKQTGDLNREQIFDEVRACYKLYIHALLELTDNMIIGKVVHPQLTQVHDADDPYLVVAADKGTATFSDTANEVSMAKQFWLQDAFASGGSAGYDHKKMGITARGAWESVKRHFRGLGRDIQKEHFTVLGIGDMSGDVFGNGMLLSPCIRLVAAFNHLNIFIDPNPDSGSSYAERKRLFEMPRSSWTDYNKSLISKGGGVFSRKLKKIPMSPEMQSMTGCSKDYVTPDELINLLLKSQVDLLWNGGIGTYVKASSETDEQVKDKANNAIRINGKELKARVVGEGGNLGFTQLGRIEYASKGGLIYTDSIDNSAGVDCSDHEVNLKIMFSRLILKGEMSMQQRNQLLLDMTDDVAQLCLQNNYDQTQIIDIVSMQSARLMHEHSRFMRHLERNKILNRKLEYLPNDESITERIVNHQGLTHPELCTLLSYSKLTYKDALLSSELAQEPYFADVLLDYFPETVREEFRDEILSHPLKREIIATQLSNQIINQIGPGFGFRMREETGSNLVSIAKAYTISKKVLEIDKLWQQLQQLDNQVAETNRYNGFLVISGLLERSISWLLRHHPLGLDVEKLIERYQADCKSLRKVIPHALTGQARKTYTTTRRQLLKQGFSSAIAAELAENIIMASAYDIIEIRITQHTNIENSARLFFAISERLQLNWIREQISASEIRNHWHQLAVANMRNSLHRYQHKLTDVILQSVKNKRHTTKALKQWMDKYSYAIERYDRILSELQAQRQLDFTMASVAVSEVRRLLSLST